MSDAHKPIQSVARAISILRCFDDTKELGLTEISRMVGLHKSTTAGIVATLRAERFLEQNERTGKLRLGLDFFTLAAGARLELVEICEPYLSHLLEKTGETVNLGILDTAQIMFIDKRESGHSMRISTRVGMRMPVYCTGMGKAILAAMEPQEAERLIDSMEMITRTQYTIADKASLLRELEFIRREGVAVDREEWKMGLVCVAASLCREPGKPVAAVSVSGPDMRMNHAAITEISRELREVAEKIGAELARYSM